MTRPLPANWKTWKSKNKLHIHYVNKKSCDNATNSKQEGLNQKKIQLNLFNKFFHCNI